ncbi:DUF6884 domain-containing protein [Actinopolymorpha pittospori]|uniref:DUF6884 domain-containing protein n=1 Tax=Actinopolymorpha pittospori TaxID=648752 RepID=A0A927R709_9ACTN|nr:DUF6884 domain-containing protein [Actinopolymorpha pittospori]MBE1603724.1 hypothetical protein [Actinopolymorpha pittospori]
MTSSRGDLTEVTGSGRRIGLVGCVKEKATKPLPARDLYISALFRGRRSFVLRSCTEWWILSAEHGLVHPDQVLAPYDKSLKSATRAERRAWSEAVLRRLDGETRPASGDVVEFHAGAEYRDYGLLEGLVARGCRVEVPTSGLPLGRQLQFYSAASA